MKWVMILGATGSVGRNVLDVIARHLDQYHVEALVAGRHLHGLVNRVPTAHCLSYPQRLPPGIAAFGFLQSKASFRAQ